MNVTKLFFKTIQIFLGILVASFALLLFVNHFGNTRFFYPYVVQSGSMEPVIPVGSVIFSLPQKNYLQGEIITFSPDNSKKLVTHRVAYKTYPQGIHGEPLYATVGDANEEIDRWEVTPSQIIGKVALTIPYLGYAVDFAKTPKGFILFVIIPATIVIYEELKNLLNELKKFVTSFRAKRENHVSSDLDNQKIASSNTLLAMTNNTSAKILILLPIFGTCIVLIAFTKAYFFDNEKAEENTIGVSTNYGTEVSVLNEETPTPTPTLTITPTISISITP